MSLIGTVINCPRCGKTYRRQMVNVDRLNELRDAAQLVISTYPSERLDADLPGPHFQAMKALRELLPAAGQQDRDDFDGSTRAK